MSDSTMKFDAPLGALTTYRVGGTVAALTRARSDDDVLAALTWAGQEGLPWRTIGNGSNLLVADGRHELAVLHLEGGLCELHMVSEGDLVVVTAGAGMDLPVASRQLAAAGLHGFEWAVGVPGTFGGAVVMNAGGHGSDMAATVRRVRLWRDGHVDWVSADTLEFGYRHSALSLHDVVLGVEMVLTPGSADVAKERLSEIVRWRRAHQPGGANAGSVFRNPDGDSAGRLLEAAGAKGLAVGGAHVSEKHANFIIADTTATANDVFALIQVLRHRVREVHGVTLHPEHHFLGFAEVS